MGKKEKALDHDFDDKSKIDEQIHEDRKIEYQSGSKKRLLHMIKSWSYYK